MIYKFKSSQAVIAKIFRDLNMQESDWVGDGVEWIGEALQAIGSLTQLVRKVEIVKTSSHKATLPADLYMIDRVKYSHNTSSITSPTEPKLEDFTHMMPYDSASLHASLVNEYSTQTGAWSGESFFISDGVINTSFEEDWIAIVYRAVNTDDDGYPMVPSHFSFDQALYWYIVMKLMERGMKHPSGEINWQIARAEWKNYCTQARTKAIMPDESKMEEFMRSWVNIIPNYNVDMKAAEQYHHRESNTYIVDSGNLVRY